jgi:two-component system nitrogen regulation sensor histidine kinase GlnL
LLRKSQDEESSFSKRDMEIANKVKEKRIIDLTVSYNNENSHIILEVKCVDSINKIIDSTKIFSTQKIAANLARTLAHEVKNPLSGIKGSAQILSKKLEDDYSKKFLKIIIEETDRLNGIVTKILTPPQKPNQEKFNIHSALEKVYALADADISPSLKLRRDYDPSIPELIGDEDLFIQAILNIVKNAQQALGEMANAEIRIKSRVQYSQPVNGIMHLTVCCIEIIDNGPGIPEEIQEHVFFPMISSKEDGSGLGLSIAQDIIRVHGGGISFTSKPGKTAFSIQIPLNIKNIGEESA